jgi:hypothetical protein
MIVLWLAGLLLGVAAGNAAAEHQRCYSCKQTLARAGHPERVAWYAKPSETPRFCSYPVGGGCAFKCKGEPRYPGEGTWGWDYCGSKCLPIRVALKWWHGRRYQGGEGDYRTDGPEVPDVPAAVNAGRVNVRAKLCPSEAEE